MAQLRTCDSKEEFMAAWKAGLLVTSMHRPVVPFTRYLELNKACDENAVFMWNWSSVFILVEEDE